MIPTTRMIYADGVVLLQNRYSTCLTTARTSRYHFSGPIITPLLTKLSQLTLSVLISWLPLSFTQQQSECSE